VPQLPGRNAHEQTNPQPDKPSFAVISLRQLRSTARLGVEIPDAGIWRTPTGGHHASAADQSADRAIDFDLDSSVFAQHWNAGWKGRTDLKGRVVVGFGVPTRADVDDVFRDMTGAGYRGLQEPYDAFWGARYAIIEDPNGIGVGLMSPVSSDKRSPPPTV
jgi:Glyoxalase/Bleomycin resistance protein/Dioxygenase superfamily